MSKYGTLQDRIRCKSLLSKVVPVEDTIQYFKDGMNLGWSGFTPAGYPKAVPIALADHVEKNNLQGKLKFSLFIGASVGARVTATTPLSALNGGAGIDPTGIKITNGANSATVSLTGLTTVQDLLTDAEHEKRAALKSIEAVEKFVSRVTSSAAK